MRTTLTILVVTVAAFATTCSDAEDPSVPPKPTETKRDVDGSGASTAPHAEQASASASLKAEITDDGEHLLLSIRLRNTGRTPIVIDKELVLLPSITLIGEGRQAVPFRQSKRIEKPSTDALKARLIELAPGAEIRRAFDLRTGFRRFVIGMSHATVAGGGVLHQATAYETIAQIPEKPQAFDVEISFTPYYAFEECLAQYLDGIDTTKLYRGPLSETVRYRPRKSNAREVRP